MTWRASHAGQIARIVFWQLGNAADANTQDASPDLTCADSILLLLCREQAVKTVSVPTEVVNVLTDLRAYLQDKLEPPVYVSDRRLVKSVALLQVSMHSFRKPAQNARLHEAVERWQGGFLTQQDDFGQDNGTGDKSNESLCGVLRLH